ncbi:MAG: aldo/keto reductase [Coriobacteriales bacterium]|jgi:predicted aldo/keto reductase-like oxidoreductase|nr:aldo/keto reductase [Coriobacteriales bacterium]
MQYVKYGQTDLEVSRLGLGCMRFPADRSQAIEMVRYAIDHGINYLDTAFVYGDSEEILGEALSQGYRERTYLVTKAPLWNVNQYADFEQHLDISLRRLGTDYLDVYLLHNLYDANLKKTRELDGSGFLDEMIAKGKIRYKGFSMHNSYEAFTDLVDDYHWDMAQIQMNILDVKMQVGQKGLSYGVEKALAMVVMEPLRGGTILLSMPPEVGELVAAYPEKRSLAEWCFRWLYSQPEATVILSGTSTLEQLKDNISIFEQADYNVLSNDDIRFIAKIRRAYQNAGAIGCTACRYCSPCKNGVKIPECFAVYNSFMISGKVTMSDRVYYSNALVSKGYGADRCERCGECAEQCPQKLEIPDLLAMLHAELTSNLPPRFRVAD